MQDEKKKIEVVTVEERMHELLEESAKSRQIDAAWVAREAERVSVMLHRRDGAMWCSSLDLAAAFGIKHNDIRYYVRGIKCSREYLAKNIVEGTLDETIKISGETIPSGQQQMFFVTRNGFELIARQITGENVAKMYEVYVRAFEMAEERAKRKPPVVDIVAEPEREIRAEIQSAMEPTGIVPYLFEGVQCRTIFDTRTQIGYVCLADLLKAQKTSRSPSQWVPKLMKVFGDGVTISYPIPDVLGRTQETAFVAEHAAAFVVSQGRTEASDRLNRWLFGEVFPSIRKTGQYVMGAKAQGDQTKLVKISEALLLAGEVIEDQQQQIEKQRAILAVAKERIEEQDRKIAEDAPKVEFHDSIFSQPKGFTVTQAARACGLTRTALFQRLVDEKILQREVRRNKCGERLSGYRYSVIDERWGGALVVQSVASSVGAATFMNQQVRVTEAGVEMLKKKFQ